MKNKSNIIINQILGTNIFENTCFCQILNAYNTKFNSKNSAVCIGRPNMQCLIYTIEGTGTILNKNKKPVKLTKNNVFFGSMNEMSLIKSTSSLWHFLCYWYTIENSNLKYNGVYRNNIDTLKEVDEINNFIKLLREGSFLKTSLANSLFTIKLLNLLEKLGLNQEIKSNTIINNILSYINLHIYEKINTKSIANEFGYCEKHIRYLFNRHLNSTPSKYIDDLKLDKIALMLQTTSYSLEHFAEIFNYSSASHLINNFKKRFKYTPKQYILRMQELYKLKEKNT